MEQVIGSQSQRPIDWLQASVGVVFIYEEVVHCSARRLACSSYQYINEGYFAAAGIAAQTLSLASFCSVLYAKIWF